MKKLLTVTLAIFLCFMSFGSACLADNGITVKIDGQAVAFDVSPQIINNRTMVPMRKIFETLGATVEWDQNTKTVTSTKGGTTVSLTIDNPKMSVNGNVVTLDTPACIVDNRTLVPVRAIAEAFQTEVNWDESTKTVSISGDGISNIEKGTTNPRETLKNYLIANGTKHNNGCYYIKLGPKSSSVFVILIYNPADNSVSFMEKVITDNAETDIVLLFKGNDSPVVSYDFKSQKGSESSLMGVYYSPEITILKETHPVFNQIIMKSIYGSYQTWDLVMEAEGLNLKIKDFGINYHKVF